MNPRVQAIGSSLIREIASKRKASSIDLGLGEPSLAPNLAHFDVAMQYVTQHGLRYTVNAGDPLLRERIDAHYAYPNLTSAENVCVTTGSQEATYVVLKTLLDPAKDELLIVDPSFPSYAKMAALDGVAARRVAMAASDDFAYDPERILAAVGEQTRAIVICSPCNPTGRVISRESVRIISDALLRRGGDPVWLLHDEIYREQTFCEDAGHFAEAYPYTVVVNSVSKSNALTGLRLGWALAPRDVSAAIVKTHAWITSCADAFAQRVALAIFENHALDEHFAWYAARLRKVESALRASGLRTIPPQGSFYACVALPEGCGSLAAAHRLADECDVIAIPGIAFGACFDGWLRLSWVTPVDRFTEGLSRIAAFCARNLDLSAPSR